MLTTYMVSRIFNNFFNGVAPGSPATWYFGGFPVSPIRTGGGTESQYPNYARAQLTAGASAFPNATGTNIVTASNGLPLSFPTPGAGASEQWNAIGMFDAATGGNLWAYLPITTLLNISAGVPIQVALNELIFQWTLNANGGLTTFAAQQALNGILQKKFLWPSGVPANWYLAGMTGNPTIAGGGVESTRPGYARALIVNATQGFTPMGGTNPMSNGNVVPINFPVLGGSGTTQWTAWALFDSPTLGSGNMVEFGILQTPLTINPGSQPQFPIGSIQAISTGTT